MPGYREFTGPKFVFLMIYKATYIYKYNIFCFLFCHQRLAPAPGPWIPSPYHLLKDFGPGFILFLLHHHFLSPHWTHFCSRNTNFKNPYLDLTSPLGYASFTCFPSQQNISKDILHIIPTTSLIPQSSLSSVRAILRTFSC